LGGLGGAALLAQGLAGCRGLGCRVLQARIGRVQGYGFGAAGAGAAGAQGSALGLCGQVWGLRSRGRAGSQGCRARGAGRPSVPRAVPGAASRRASRPTSAGVTTTAPAAARAAATRRRPSRRCAAPLPTTQTCTQHPPPRGPTFEKTRASASWCSGRSSAASSAAHRPTQKGRATRANASDMPWATRLAETAGGAKPGTWPWGGRNQQEESMHHTYTQGSLHVVQTDCGTRRSLASTRQAGRQAGVGITLRPVEAAALRSQQEAARAAARDTGAFVHKRPPAPGPRTIRQARGEERRHHGALDPGLGPELGHDAAVQGLQHEGDADKVVRGVGGEVVPELELGGVDLGVCTLCCCVCVCVCVL
jgi:hypothetical protein